MKYIYIAICLIIVGFEVSYTQVHEQAPEYVPSDFDILYTHDGVTVNKETIKKEKEKMYIDQAYSNYDLQGYASYYAEKFHNRTTANGEKFDMNALTAAHRSLPFNSIVKVTNQDNGNSVTVRINDRGPYIDNRVIDVSKKAAEKLSMIASGLAPVSIEIISLSAIKSKQANTNGKKEHFQNKYDTVNIQVASYSKRKNAQKLIHRLHEHNIQAEIEYTNNYYRVIIANLDKENYTAISNTLNKLGFIQTIVRSNITK